MNHKNTKTQRSANILTAMAYACLLQVAMNMPLELNSCGQSKIEVRWQRSEVGEQRSEVSGWRSDF